MDKKVVNKKNFIDFLAKKANFTKNDISIIYDSIVEILEEYAREGITAKLYSLGKFEVIEIGERLGSSGETLPKTTKVVFRLAENIRQAGKSRR